MTDKFSALFADSTLPLRGIEVQEKTTVQEEVKGQTIDVDVPSLAANGPLAAISYFKNGKPAFRYVLTRPGCREEDIATFRRAFGFEGEPGFETNAGLTAN